jgi:hypothetical protein
MAKQNINIGVNPNDGTGDVVREAFRKSKENFDELYARPTGDMNKSTYDSDNSGAVDQADKITGVDAAGNVTYYGKDATGNIGFHTFSPDKVDSYADFASFPVAGFEGVVYIDLENLALYLWDDVNEVYVLAGGTTYSTFTDTEDGLVPAPNAGGGTTYSASITSPTEGFTATEGQVTTVNVDLPAGVVSSGVEKVLHNDGWKSANREEKYIDGNTTPNYTLVADDKNKFLSIRYADVNITIPSGVFSNGDIIRGYCYTGNVFINSSLGYTDYPLGSTNKCWGYFEIKISSTSVTTPNEDAALIYGDFIKDKNYLKSPNGTIWMIEVDDAGVITVTDSLYNY